MSGRNYIGSTVRRGGHIRAAVRSDLERFALESPINSSSVPRPRQKLTGFDRLGYEIALRQVAAELAKQIPILFGLDAFCDSDNTELFRHIDRRLEDDSRGLLRGGAPYECLIQLNFGKGDARKLLQRRIAGAVVINGQSEAFHAQARQIFERMADLGRRGGFGDFEDYVSEIKVFAFYKCDHTISEIHVGQRFRRHVDRHADVQSAFCSPHTAEIHRLTEYQPRELIDMAVTLKRPNKSVRSHNALLRVAPSRERFSACDASTCQLYLGLKEGLELVISNPLYDLFDGKGGGVRSDRIGVYLCGEMKFDQCGQFLLRDRLLDDP